MSEISGKLHIMYIGNVMYVHIENLTVKVHISSHGIVRRVLYPLYGTCVVGIDRMIGIPSSEI